MGRTTPATNKILIALTFWKGDKAHALELARLLADLEPAHSKAADFLLVNRFDCEPDPQTLEYLSRKFNVFSHTSTRKNVGWPDGCNALALSMMDWVWSMLSYRRIPKYKAVLNVEADCAPLMRDWLPRLSAAWDEANATKKVCVAGPLVQAPAEHINANALYSTDLEFLTWLTRRTNVAGGGWDFLLASAFRRRGWADIPGMCSYWNTPHFSEQDFDSMLEAGRVWVHGDKSGDLLKISRKRLL